ncbi:MAG: class II glutamine amidotransferase [Burkholderiaceae bacterium]|nr:class II glutamine amidotransferase [Burkholderiaceae bacterium]
MTHTGLIMCELLALSSSQPERLTFSLRTLASRGGQTNTTHDGWGVAFYEGEDVALFREPAAAADSALVRFLETQGPSTHLAISHIRHATQGTVQLSNTQPFVRELGGRTHVFAHNGNLPGIEGSAVLALGSYRPVGQTDSEHAFCALLARLRPLWEDANPPSLQARLSLLTTFAAELRALGPANFLYADGDALFAHGHRRLQHASGRAEPPGLWTLQRRCAPTNTSPDQHGGLAINPVGQAVVLIASVPLTDEAWRPLAEGELLAVRAGEVLEIQTPALS